MGFNRCIRVLRHQWQVKHIRTALQTFSDQFPEVMANLDTDPEVTDAHRLRLLKDWLGCNPNDGHSLMRQLESFCRKPRGRFHWNKLRGRIDQKAVGRVLGHAMERRRLERIVANLRGSPYRAGGSSAKLAVSHLLGLDLHGQKTLMISLKLKNLNKSPLMWSFYDDHDTADPFKSIRRKTRDLRTRLGLGNVDPGAELLTLSHRLPRMIEPHVPTTLDAESSPYFRPGGRTKRLGRSKKPGWPEVVHLTTSGQYLEEAIRPAT